MKNRNLLLSLAMTIGMSTSAWAQNSYPDSGPVYAKRYTVAGPSEQFPFVHGGATNNIANYGLSVGPHVPSLGASVIGLSGWAGIGLFTDSQNRLFVDAAGNIGIGTTTPTSTLTIGSGYNANARRAISIIAGWSEPGAPGTSVPGDRIIFWNASDGLYKTSIGFGTQNDMWFQSTVPQGRTAFRFYVGDGERAAPVERLGINGNGVDVNGNLNVAGKIATSTLELTSDRHKKQDLQIVDVGKVLAKVGTLTISTWAYTNSPSIRHIGPMAQDVKTAFPEIGEDDKHISAVDGIGVALAAIKGLHQLVVDKDTEIVALKRELTAMKQELASARDSVTDRLAALEKAFAARVEQQAEAPAESIR